MTEDQLEHLIRASGAILGDSEVWIIGSQSLLPWLREKAGQPPRSWPRVFTLSTEADIIPVDDDSKKIDLVDGVLGEDSYFHDSFGAYAQGVSMKTAVLPEGWQSRCYPLKNPNTMGVTGYCLHPADLFIAKSVANREKDSEFLDALIEYGLVKEKTVLHLLPKVSRLDSPSLDALRERILGRFRKIQKNLHRIGEGCELFDPGHGRINTRIVSVTNDTVVLQHAGREKVLDAVIPPEHRQALKEMEGQRVVLQFGAQGLERVAPEPVRTRGRDRESPGL